MSSGKSCLSHVVIEDIMRLADPKSGHALAYFYVDGSEARGASDHATKVLRCLLKQLADPGSYGTIRDAVVISCTNGVLSGRN